MVTYGSRRLVNNGKAPELELLEAINGREFPSLAYDVDGTSSDRIVFRRNNSTALAISPLLAVRKCLACF